MNKFCLNDKNKILLMTALGSGVAALAAAAALAATGPTIASASFTAFFYNRSFGRFCTLRRQSCVGREPIAGICCTRV
jgi:hypothetical protein